MKAKDLLLKTFFRILCDVDEYGDQPAIHFLGYAFRGWDKKIWVVRYTNFLAPLEEVRRVGFDTFERRHRIECRERIERYDPENEVDLDGKEMCRNDLDVYGSAIEYGNYYVTYDEPGYRGYLFTKTGRAKKSYCRCLSREQRSMFRRLYGREIDQCAGCACSYYGVFCGRSNMREYEAYKDKKGQKKGNIL